MSTSPLQRLTADNFPKHFLRRHCLYVAGAALEPTVLKEGSTSSLARDGLAAQQYKKNIQSKLCHLSISLCKPRSPLYLYPSRITEHNKPCQGQIHYQPSG